MFVHAPPTARGPPPPLPFPIGVRAARLMGGVRPLVVLIGLWLAATLDEMKGVPFPMRFYIHRVLQQIYASLADPPVWKGTRPDGAVSRHRCLHLYARLAPDQGRPVHECGLIPVYEAMVTAYLTEIEPGQAHRYDPGLVDYLFRLCTCPALPTLQRLLSPGARLHLVDYGPSEDGRAFDVYLVPASSTRILYLNPLLASLLPVQQREGTARLLAPLSGEAVHSGMLLAQAIAARVWGERETAPPFVFEIAHP